MQQILESIPKRRILTLRPTYSRIALSDLARKVGLGDAAGAAAVKDVIGRVIATGEIRASVTGSPEIVTFEDDDDYDSPAAMKRLADAQAVASSLLAELTRADQQLGLNPKWLQKVSYLHRTKLTLHSRCVQSRRRRSRRSPRARWPRAGASSVSAALLVQTSPTLGSRRGEDHVD